MGNQKLTSEEAASPLWEDVRLGECMGRGSVLGDEASVISCSAAQTISSSALSPLVSEFVLLTVDFFATNRRPARDPFVASPQDESPLGALATIGLGAPG